MTRKEENLSEFFIKFIAWDSFSIILSVFVKADATMKFAVVLLVLAASVLVSSRKWISIELLAYLGVFTVIRGDCLRTAMDGSTFLRSNPIFDSSTGWRSSRRFNHFPSSHSDISFRSHTEFRNRQCLGRRCHQTDATFSFRAKQNNTSSLSSQSSTQRYRYYQLERWSSVRQVCGANCAATSSPVLALWGNYLQIFCLCKYFKLICSLRTSKEQLWAWAVSPVKRIQVCIYIPRFPRLFHDFQLHRSHGGFLACNHTGTLHSTSSSTRCCSTILRRRHAHAKRHLLRRCWRSSRDTYTRRWGFDWNRHNTHLPHQCSNAIRAIALHKSFILPRMDSSTNSSLN